MINEDNEIVDVVDEKDKITGKMTRDEANARNMIMRASRVIILNKKGEILIHKRAETKKRYPGHYDIGTVETLHSGETYETAAKRGLKEELGIEAQVKFVFSLSTNFEGSKRNYGVYLCIHNGQVFPDKREIEEAKFVTAGKLNHLLKTEKFTPSGQLALKIYLKRETK